MTSEEADDADDKRHICAFLWNVPQLEGELLWGGGVERQCGREADKGEEDRRERRSAEITLGNRPLPHHDPRIESSSGREHMHDMDDNRTWLDWLKRSKPSIQVSASWTTTPPSMPCSFTMTLNSFSNAPSNAMIF